MTENTDFSQLYDVCNDYSLYSCEEKNLDKEYQFRYGNVDGIKVKFYTDWKHGEVHYARGPKGLNNKYLF